MKRIFILTLLAVCVIVAGCSSSIIDNTYTPVSTAPDEELDALFESSLPGPSLPPDEEPDGIFCTDYTGRGLLRVRYQGEEGAKLKLEVLSDRQSVFYNLKGDGSIEDFSLQFGSGKYTARIWQNIKNDDYFAAEAKSFDVSLVDDTIAYLNSIQNVDWGYGMKPIKDVRYIVADSLKNKRNDLLYSCGVDIYGYIVHNIKYDDAKLYSLKYDYLPDIEQVYNDGKGICYDYASLFASMLRSINVPAKLVKGYANYSPDTYHAWNEVYIDGEWVVIDITRDASLYSSGAAFVIEKDGDDYTKVHEY